MQSVTVQNSTAERIDEMTANISQTITWEAPPLHRNIKNYTITYEMGPDTTSSTIEASTGNNATQTTLVLPASRGKGSTYSVRVAAVSQYGRGEFSDKVELAYSSKLMGLVQSW